ncbi:MAG TPA: DUF6662 family protein [Rickettsiales bacterium]|nr:DUF6662 family protein [Rickettsiales bacterium]
MRNLTKTFAALAVAATLIAPLQQAHAEESQFGYVYTTDLLPKGQKEAVQWTTWRHDKADMNDGYFDMVDGRTEIEYGVADNFQLGVYASYAATRAYHNGPDGATTPPETFAGRTLVGADDHYADRELIGFSVEGIYRILSPYKDSVGLAVLFEPTIGRNLHELESRIILQKNFLDDRLVFAGNITIAQEDRWLPFDPGEGADGHWDHESDINFGLAGSYRFAPNWTFGLEFLNEREYSCFCVKSGNRTNNAFYTGPTVEYGGEDFFVALTALEQLRLASDYTGGGAVIDGRNYADDFEKYRVRLKFGFYF